jgi:pimeloyl-ACP methyl ester carboxylesterase
MDRAHEINLPALVICGEMDIMTPSKYANYLGANIANSKVVIVPKAGHLVLAEKPDVVNKAIEDFLRAISS